MSYEDLWVGKVYMPKNTELAIKCSPNLRLTPSAQEICKFLFLAPIVITDTIKIKTSGLKCSVSKFHT